MNSLFLKTQIKNDINFPLVFPNPQQALGAVSDSGFSWGWFSWEISGSQKQFWGCGSWFPSEIRAGLAGALLAFCRSPTPCEWKLLFLVINLVFRLIDLFCFIFSPSLCMPIYKKLGQQYNELKYFLFIQNPRCNWVILKALRRICFFVEQS